MKKYYTFLFLSLCAAIGIWFSLGEKQVFSSGLAVTNTPSLSSPTPLPTEMLTATPTLIPSPTLAPSPTISPTDLPTVDPTSTPTVQATQAQTATSIPTASGLPNLGNGEAQIDDFSLDSPVMQIEISPLELNAPVGRIRYAGGDWDISRLGSWVGWLEGTSQPGLGGNTVLVGHLNLQGGFAGPFANLGQLQPGTEIKVYTADKVYSYYVKYLTIVSADDLSILKPSNFSQLTLVTCLPSSWDSAGRVFLQRRVVVAKFYSMVDRGSWDQGK